MTRAAVLGGAWALCAAMSQAAAEPILEPLGLYSGRTVVSGTGEANREAGFSACLLDVLAKVSGDPSLLTDAGAIALSRGAGRQVVRFGYRDRLEGRPVHDEQGTYDRPHHLTATFDPEAIEADLSRLGRKPWRGPRPVIRVDLSVEGRRAAFRLSQDDDVDVSAAMRASLALAGETQGLAVTLPRKAGEGAGDAGEDLPDTVSLAGRLSWSDEALGWVVSWHLRHDGRDHLWTLRGVGFDEAFRTGLRGAAQILSGSGAPD